MSPLLKSLRMRVTEIEESFLPKIAATSAMTNPKDYDSQAAYMLLIAAEIETFIEEHCREVLKRANANWAKGVVSLACKYLILAKECNVPRDKNTTYSGAFTIAKNNKWFSTMKVELDSSFQGAKQSYQSKLETNHGVAAHNLRQILYPLGLFEKRLDPLLVASLESFSKQRGSVAHKSATARTMQHPTIVRGDVVNILRLLENFDRMMIRAG